VPAAAIRIEGGGHQIPRFLPSFGPTMEAVLGPRNRDVDAAEAIWSFFKAGAR
jgi:poly(3-hydroxybutyrate) depolymerase